MSSLCDVSKFCRNPSMKHQFMADQSFLSSHYNGPGILRVRRYRVSLDKNININFIRTCALFLRPPSSATSTSANVYLTYHYESTIYILSTRSWVARSHAETRDWNSSILFQGVTWLLQHNIFSQFSGMRSSLMKPAARLWLVWWKGRNQISLYFCECIKNKYYILRLPSQKYFLLLRRLRYKTWKTFKIWRLFTNKLLTIF
jgi:hypothetical protein